MARLRVGSVVALAVVGFLGVGTRPAGASGAGVLPPGALQDLDAKVSVVTFTVPTGRPAEKMTVSGGFEDVNGGEFVRGVAPAAR